MKKNARKTTRTAGADDVDPTFAPIIDAFARDRAVSRGKMFGAVGLKVNGNDASTGGPEQAVEIPRLRP